MTFRSSSIREKRNIAIDYAVLTSLGMTLDQAHRWIEKTTALRQSCGCETGARFIAAMLLVYPMLWYWVLSDYLTIWLAILVGPAALFIAGGAGKLIGLLSARLQIYLRFRDIRLRIRETSQT